MENAVVLLSGGIDSSTTLAVANAGRFNIYALSFDYGQRHKIELDYAKKNAEKCKAIKHLIIDIKMGDIGGSALTSDIEVPKNVQSSESRFQDNDNNNHAALKNSSEGPRASTIPVTYVPARNTIFLSFALAWAETLEAADIFIGANAVDYSGYPDCRPEFIQAFENMANLATKVSVEGKIRFNINAPLIRLTKAEIIRKGIELGVDYSLSWSCYDPQPAQPSFHLEEQEKTIDSVLITPDYNVIACMKCDSCLIGQKVFARQE